nr:ester cyclase [Kibdelosporangium sp. MJ126-NF4]CEL17428.1 hypothetical protein [Kibdelosporangium sp. MJ126-NF4]CTQ91345.1 hypothetical protein [Kibdelosporangium sp. MJ126-NF4]
MRAIVERLWNDGVAEHFSHDVVAHVPERPPLHGTTALVSYVEDFRTAFPDLRLQVEATVTEGDEVVLRASMTGTHLGDYDGIPATGRPVLITDLVWLSRSRDEVTSLWRQTNNLALLDQLGILPPEDASPMRQLGHTFATVGRLVAMKAKEHRHA